jgi:hypothetical protein
LLSAVVVNEFTSRADTLVVGDGKGRGACKAGCIGAAGKAGVVTGQAV